ncbi:MAG TPA: hypothetical protein VNO30_02405 [Kofleriaceae bacterium]|nr:hypothetical protein [Kofleriaceae bacterium]
MKLVVVAALSLLASCKDRPRESPQQPASSQQQAPLAPAQPAGAGAPAGPAGGAAAAPPAQNVPDICRLGLDALDNATCTKPEARGSLVDARKAIAHTSETVGKIAEADPRQLQVMCAQMLLAIERDAATLSCTLAIDARRRKEITTLLDAWFGQRTKVTPTGDAAADAVIARIAAVRDAACECRDVACLDRVDKQLVEIAAMPQAAPEAARALGVRLLEDASRCASRVRTFGDQSR